MQDYHQLEIWQRAMTYVVQLYRWSADLPDSERYNLTAQVRKAATSVPLNIAEGSGCTSDGDFARFLGYAYRSLKEVVTALELCHRLYPALPSDSVTMLIDEGNQIARMTRSLMQRLGSAAQASAPTQNSTLTTQD
jgi:four helix bundle protein